MIIITQNGTAIMKVEREARAADWARVCDEVEARLGRPTPENVQAFRAALEKAEASLPALASEMEIEWPASPEGVKAILERTGGAVLILEEHEGQVVGVVHVPS
jgi:hypothetical protein